jgi:hypothetical protein
MSPRPHSPAPVRLENLTAHAIVLDTTALPDVHATGPAANAAPTDGTHPDRAASPDRAANPDRADNLDRAANPDRADHLDRAANPDRAASVVTVFASGAMARVAEPRLGEAIIATTAGTVREVRLRRSADIEGLPPPRDGVLYVVPRLTALAAAGRDDLVFPHEEHRDSAGQVIGAAALGRFEPQTRSRRPPDGVLRRQRDVSTITRRLGVVLAVATALLGGALGVAPDVVAADPGKADFWPRIVSGLVLLAAGGMTLWGGVRLWRHREDLLHRRGTAYVIDELAEAWTYEEKQSFLADLASHFAVVLRVPGPAELGDAWRWPLGPGAERWHEKVEDLVRAFWAVHYNDDQATHNAVLIWAWWPVAVGFAARATLGRRRVTLRVRQRPSSGREGPLDGAGWRKEPHRFVRDPGLATLGREVPARTVTVTVTPRRAGPSGSAPPATPGRTPTAPTLLLVRMTRGLWGDTLAPDTPPDTPVTLQIDDAAGIGFAGTAPVRLLEWQHLAPPDTFHPWQDAPALAQSATEWISRTTRGLPGPVLLGMLVPQEVGVGMGVLIGALPRDRWPQHLWPVHLERPRTGQPLVIPGLDLGTTWIHAEGRS